jgi:hypothetical protein
MLQEHAESQIPSVNWAGKWVQGGRKINGDRRCIMIVILRQRAVVCWQAVRRKKHLPIGYTFIRRWMECGESVGRIQLLGLSLILEPHFQLKHPLSVFSS